MQNVQYLSEVVTGDFRHKKILQSWNGIESGDYQRVTVSLTVSSGTYIRSLNTIVEKMVERPVCLLHLFRSHVDVKI